MVNYQQGKIYKIESSQTDMIYIGSTCENYLSRRMSKHRTNYKCYLNDKGNNCSSFEILKYSDSIITLIELYPCNTRCELLARERFHIQENNCLAINKLRNPGMTLELNKKEYQNFVYHENKEHYREKNKRFYHKHKDERKIKDKIYRENNKDLIKDRINKYQVSRTICTCGQVIANGSMYRHKKRMNHYNALCNILDDLVLLDL